MTSLSLDDYRLYRFHLSTTTSLPSTSLPSHLFPSAPLYYSTTQLRPPHRITTQPLPTSISTSTTYTLHSLPSTHSVELDPALHQLSHSLTHLRLQPYLELPCVHPTCSLAGPLRTLTNSTIPPSLCLPPNRTRPPRCTTRRLSRLPIIRAFAWIPTDRYQQHSHPHSTSFLPNYPSLDGLPLPLRPSCTCRVTEPRRCSPIPVGDTRPLIRRAPRPLAAPASTIWRHTWPRPRRLGVRGRVTGLWGISQLRKR